MGSIDDSLDDDVFEAIADPEMASLNIKNELDGKSPSPTGYRNYKPPEEVLRLREEEDLVDESDTIVHKVRDTIYDAIRDCLVNMRMGHETGILESIVTFRSLHRFFLFGTEFKIVFCFRFYFLNRERIFLSPSKCFGNLQKFFLGMAR